jgi:hypothetical protein
MEEIIKNWLRQLATNTAFPDGIIAFNFGIFETEEGYAMYLAGANMYDAEDDDWACNPIYESSCLSLSMEDSENRDWRTFIHDVKSILEVEVKSYRIFSDKAITIGFDDGNLEEFFCQ